MAAARGVPLGRRPQSPRGDDPADMAKLDEVREMVATVVAEFGAIDVLVNNAGVFPRVDFLTMTEADWDFVHDVNLKGAVFCAQAAAQAMVAAGKGGAIVNITSGAAFRGSPRGVHYVASKGGIVSMTRQMALELAPHRIRVSGCPRPYRYRPAALRSSGGDRRDGRGQPAAASPSRRILPARLYLASDQAGFVTSHTLHQRRSYLY